MSFGKPVFLAAAVAASVAATGAASAHPGNHSHMTVAELAEHLGSLWHALPLVGIAAFGAVFLVLQARRKAMAKMRLAKKERK